MPLSRVFLSSNQADTGDLDSKDPANKHEVGGLDEADTTGVEACYRLFDAGKSRCAVASLDGDQLRRGHASLRYARSWVSEPGQTAPPYVGAELDLDIVAEGGK
jgi:hypothetical protein